MTASPSNDTEDGMMETAFSRFAQEPHRKKRSGYGTNDATGIAEENLMDYSKDLLLDVDSLQEHEFSLFDNLNDDEEEFVYKESDKEEDTNDENESSQQQQQHDASSMSEDDNEASEDHHDAGNDKEVNNDQSTEGLEQVKRPVLDDDGASDFDNDASDKQDDDSMEKKVDPESREQVPEGRTKRVLCKSPSKEPNDSVSCEEPTGEANTESSREKNHQTEEPNAASSDKADDDVKSNQVQGEENEKQTTKDDALTNDEPKEQPDKESLILSIDNLFVHADKQTVTVKDIVRSLEAEYDVKFEKPTKALVRSHLTDLITGVVEPSVPQVESEEDEEEESVSGDFESESSEYEDEEEVKKEKVKKQRRRAKKKKKTTTEPKKRTSSRRKPPKKPSHIRIHAEMLRKRRIEELRVRNEELQLKQSKEDQKRAELIAAKFETNTEELRLKRMEDRLDLLQKLDQKRIRVISIDSKDEGDKPTMKEVKDEPMEAKESNDVPSSTEDTDSEDDLELEIVGKDVPSVAATVTARITHPPKSSALSMLDMVSRLKPSEKKKSKGTVSLTADQPQASPGKSMTARATLRNALLAKQRKAGNMWLARELGYKTEQDHLRDCVMAESKKREEVMKKEAERLRTNERKQLRERMLMEGEACEEEEEEFIGDREMNARNETKTSATDGGDESDEEMAMAREIEEEQDKGDESSDFPTNDADESTDQVEDERHGDDCHGDVDYESKDRSGIDASPAAPESTADEDAHDNPNVSSHAHTERKQNVQEPAFENVDASVTDDSMSTFANEDNESPRQQAEEPSEHEASPPDMSSDAGSGTNDEKALTEAEKSTEEDNDASEENEFEGDSKDGDTVNGSKEENPKRQKNSAWQAMLQKEAEKIKKLKARKGGRGLVEAEADEEEEEDAVTGLEDFGFSLHKKKNSDEEDEELEADKITEEDMKHVVDDVSDDEGDEEAGAAARKQLAQQEEKERHKEIIRRMRDGYDGRRGGIAGAGVGARGMHRFDQLVAADNRDDAKRLGLLNDDEIDSDDDGEQGDGDKNDDEIEDETALLDKMLKDRFLHRSSTEVLEENFSDDEADEEDATNDDDAAADDEEEKEQDRLAKRFAKRARMQRLLEIHGDDEEFSQLRLIDEDETTRLELKMMKNANKKPRQSSLGSSRSSQSGSNDSREGSESIFSVRKDPNELTVGRSSLSLALQASRSTKKKTSFLGGSAGGAGKDRAASIQKCVSLGHVVFNTGGESQHSRTESSSRSNASKFNGTSGKRKRTTLPTSTSLWTKVSANGFKRRR